MWRIAENLLSNVIKYSMPHSRVYIDMGSDLAYGSFTIKNISAFPLNISPEQLTERFVRGDQARSTEGSGLGLSIAQSLTVLQGGKFQIQIDGDLFKVSVSLPLWPEE
jgi:signal transduction histidine kinase